MSWEVTSQQSDQVTTDTAGNTVTGVRVYFLTGLGNRGSVLIPNDLYSAANVAEAISIMADRFDSVSQLTSATPATG